MIEIKKYNYIIGIDPGVSTGFCVWNRPGKRIKVIGTLKIHEAISEVRLWHESTSGYLFVRVEDARKRKWFGNSGREKLQGAGSAKRDAKIWEDFLTDLGVNFEMVAPKNNKTKLNSKAFKKITGWEGKTNEHSRDAGMLVVGL